MFGVQNDANNFGYSAGLLANTIANRPNRAALGTLFVSTDTLLLYRWTGSAWVEISGGGGTITGAFNGCQEQANEIGLGGVLSEATVIETENFPITFASGATDTPQFQVITDAAISEMAIFTSLSPFNDGGVYIGNFETFGTIQSKEYAGQTPTELRINYDGGNIQLGSISNVGLYIDAIGQITTQYNTSNIGLNLDLIGGAFVLGDYDFAAGGTYLGVYDANNYIVTYSGNSEKGLKLDFANANYLLGDFSGTNNQSIFGVDDDQQTLLCDNVTSLDPGASIVGWIKIRVDGGYYVLPYYNI